MSMNVVTNFRMLTNLICNLCNQMERDGGKRVNSIEDVVNLLNNTIKDEHLVFEESTSNNKDNYMEATKLLNQWFISKEKINELNELLLSASEKRNQVLNELGNQLFLSSRTLMEEYLDIYFEIMLFMYFHNEELKSNETAHKMILRLVLTVDQYSTVSPKILNRFNYFYPVLLDYASKVSSRSSKTYIESNKNIVKNHFRKIFGCDEEINMLGLLDIISKELELNHKPHIQVAIFGKLDEETVKTVMNAVLENMNETKNVTFNFYEENCYLDDVVFEKNGKSITCKYYADTQFNGICGQITTDIFEKDLLSVYDFIFLLSNCKFLHNDNDIIDSERTFKTCCMPVITYKEILDVTCTTPLNCLKLYENEFEKVISCLETYVKYNYLGKMKRNLNHHLIEYIIDIYKKKNNIEIPSAIYIICSDVAQFEKYFENSYFYQGREVCDGKEHSVMRISKQSM